MTAVSSPSSPAIRRLRQMVDDGGGRGGAISAVDLARVLAKVGGDLDIAATAILMQPRPDWLRQMIHGSGLPIGATNIRY